MFPMTDSAMPYNVNYPHNFSHSPSLPPGNSGTSTDSAVAGPIHSLNSKYSCIFVLLYQFIIYKFTNKFVCFCLPIAICIEKQL